MTITMLKAKIHRATVTQAELDYVGSITVDMDLLEQAGKEQELSIRIQREDIFNAMHRI